MMMDSVKEFFNYVGIFFILYMVGYATFLFLAVAVGSSTLYRLKQRNILKNELHQEYYVPVTIIVPAYNEEVTIISTIRSLLSLDYHLYEIVIVDDGSTDSTAQLIQDTFHMRQLARPIRRMISCQQEHAVFETQEFKVPITLVCKKNGGKADALNMGINISRFPYFVCMDADSVLQHDSLEKIVRPVLEDGSVVAVGGAVRPCNGAEIRNGRVISYHMPKKIILCMQVLEYDRSFLAARILFDRFNGSIIISGAFGLFKKSLVISAGGYDPTTVGEDMELVVKLHVFCRQHDILYRIRYATDAVCWTQAPETLKDLCKQRRRWHIGLFESMSRHRKILANRKYGLVGFISYLYFLLYELLSPYIELFGIMTVILAFVIDLINVPFMVLFFAIYVIYSAVLSLTAFFARIQTVDLKLTPGDILKAVGLCALEVSCLRFILSWVRATSLIGYRKKKYSWGKIRREKINIR